MKKIYSLIILIGIMLTLSSCDIEYVYSLDVKSLDENLNYIIDDEMYESYQYYYRTMNFQFKTNYSDIDFLGNDIGLSMPYQFELLSKVDDTYSMSLKLLNNKQYVVDFLRIAVIIDDTVKVYKYYDENEVIFHKENDPETILHFNSETEIFNDFTIDLLENEPKTIKILVWIEEAELYDARGNRYKGWQDHSYYATPVELSLEIE
jgi:hypothetical protein